MLDPLLAEQVAYYRAIAGEYEEHAIPGAWGGELSAALASFRPAGSVLELACGPGMWTNQLCRHAVDVTAVDAAPEMLAIARPRPRRTGPLHSRGHLRVGTGPPLRRGVLWLLAVACAA
jgi:2-polyprenyl-3-methyl-5-hydroxy-6-metoxy-1,4-benzoquinol methylase